MLRTARGPSLEVDVGGAAGRVPRVAVVAEVLARDDALTRDRDGRVAVEVRVEVGRPVVTPEVEPEATEAPSIDTSAPASSS